MLHYLRCVREMLANLYPGYTRADAAKLAAHFTGGIGLGIESVEMAGAAIEPNEDAGLRPCRRCRSLQLEHLRQAQAKGAE